MKYDRNKDFHVQKFYYRVECCGLRKIVIGEKVIEKILISNYGVEKCHERKTFFFYLRIAFLKNE